MYTVPKSCCQVEEYNCKTTFIFEHEINTDIYQQVQFFYKNKTIFKNL
jgi:hypothetical protein